MTLIGHGLALKHDPEEFDPDNPTQASCAFCEQPAVWARCANGQDTYVCIAHLQSGDDK